MSSIAINLKHSSLVRKFKENPTLYYAMSIAATWAGVGSLVNTMTVATEHGVVPWIIWSIGNTLASIVFGLLIVAIPKLEAVFLSKPMMLILGVMSMFQIWLSMNGIQGAFKETIVGGTAGMVIAYAFAIFFLILLFRYGMIRNVLTDNFSWSAVYALAIILVIAALIMSGGQMNHLSMGLDAENIKFGINKGILLIPGALTYPYFFELVKYNHENEEGTSKVDIRKTFCIGGILFGVYLIAPFILAWTYFNPALAIVKAVLITLVGISTLSSFMYSIYLVFGRKIGLAINVLALAVWIPFISMGVMGVWTLMSQIRIYIVGAGVLVAIILSIRSKYENSNKEDI